MDEKALYKILTTVLWQDFSGFLREEKEKEPDKFDDILKTIICLMIPILNVIILVLLLCMIIETIMNRKKIIQNAYDIEITPSNIKLIRNCANQYGLCRWNGYSDNELLIASVYDNIEKGSETTYILKKDGYLGLFSIETKSIIAECVYDKIENISGSIFKLSRSGKETKINAKGDRVMI